MRIWLEKADTDYYIHLEEPEWEEVGDGGGSWFTKDGANCGLAVCDDVIEAILPHANEMRVGDLAEIELVNCGVWLPLADTGDDIVRDEPSSIAAWELIPGRAVRNFNEEIDEE